MKNVTIYSFSTPQLKRLEKRFLKTLKKNWDGKIKIEHMDVSQEGKGDFRSESFYESLFYKMKRIVEIIKENIGNIIIISDVDIQFFKPISPIIEEYIKDNDIVFQSEYWPNDRKEVNTGFVTIRCNENTLSFWNKISNKDFRETGGNQVLINHLLREELLNFKYGVFPNEFFATTHLIFPNNITLHHANWTHAPHSLRKKICQMRLVRIIRVFSLINKKIGNLLFHFIRSIKIKTECF